MTILVVLFSSLAAFAGSFESGQRALQSMTGCFLVDFNYTETHSLKQGYERDSRVYDVNKDKSVKEWIYSDAIAPGHLRLQHVMFVTDKEGKVYEGSFLKHTGDEWQYEAPFRYEFEGPSHWKVVKDSAAPGMWTRRTTNLDDGLRYSCAAEWSNEAYPTFECSNYAPIPGRETRDMGRKDYNTLERNTKLVAYGNSWLERQTNVKVIHQEGLRTPLAKEEGKNWYVRLPDSECAPAQGFMANRKSFWQVMRDAWLQVLDGTSDFREKVVAPGAPNRYGKIMALEEHYITQNLEDASVRAAALEDIKDIIHAYRAR